MPQPELKSCPFCGGEAHMHAVRDGRQVGCHTCLANGPAEYHGPDGYEGALQRAIAAWNRRADQRLAAGAEAEANRREDAKSERLAGGAPNANSGSLPPLALAPGGREPQPAPQAVPPKRKPTVYPDDLPSPPSGWRPISGAQHVEGNKVLVYTIWHEHVIVRYVPNMGDGSRPWYDDDDMWLADKDIRGWQPLPPAPSSEQPKEAGDG